MKKTLFAMLALATMMPAMADNWSLNYAYVNPYEDILTPDEVATKHTLYLITSENTDLASVKTELEDKTFTEFLSTSGSGIAFDSYDPDWKQLCMYNGPLQTELSLTIDKNNIWGVCVYQNEDVVRFLVLETGIGGETGPDIKPSSLKIYAGGGDGDIGLGYTSFSSGSVPEPSTATLSLLALAGLASRRKRK